MPKFSDNQLGVFYMRYIENMTVKEISQRKKTTTQAIYKTLKKIGQKLGIKLKSQNRNVTQFLNRYKLSKGCTDCDYNQNPRALEFDHVRGIKECNVSECSTIEKAKEEIKKCEVVCSNCHKIRTQRRRKTPKQLLQYIHCQGGYQRGYQGGLSKGLSL